MASRTQEKSIEDHVAAVLAWLKRRGTKRNRDGMARYGIRVGNGQVFGVSMATMQTLARRLGRDHQLAAALWESGWYEARILTSFVDDPAQVTSAQMDRWCRAFDNWAICDTLCLHLFDRTPHAWQKVDFLGKDAARQLTRPLVLRRLKARESQQLPSMHSSRPAGPGEVRS